MANTQPQVEFPPMDVHDFFVHLTKIALYEKAEFEARRQL